MYTVTKSDKTLRGTINLTASKSESNRALIIQALCKDAFEIKNLATAKDTETLQELLSSNNSTLDVGPAGTTYRFLTAYLATQKGRETILTGSQRMQERPIGILVDALRSIGADIEYVENEGYPPLKIKGKQLHGGTIEIHGDISSQYISALLLIAPTLIGGLKIRFKGKVVSKPYIQMTLNIMANFGATYTWQNNTIIIDEAAYRAEQFTVEADWSAAAFWYEMVALSEDADITITGLKEQSFQGDATVVEVYEKLGVQTIFKLGEIQIQFNKVNLKKDFFEYDFTTCPDMVQAVTCTLAALSIPFKFSGVMTLRIKETERVEALRKEWDKAGIKIKDINADAMEMPDSVTPNEFVTSVATYHDHRMAMAFAPLALQFNSIKIEDPDVVVKSYPEFWEHLKSVGFEIG
jgi:3-phosphoshikimate 1-carboxyvinyltransferase